MWHELLNEKSDEQLSAMMHLVQMDDQISWVQRCSTQDTGGPQQCQQLWMRPVQIMCSSRDGAFKHKQLFPWQLSGVNLGQFLFSRHMHVKDRLVKAHVKHGQLCQGYARVMASVTADAGIAQTASLLIQD